MKRPTRSRTAVVLAGLLGAALVTFGAPASADGGSPDVATIDHASATKDGHLDLLVTVPGTDPIDLKSARVSVNGKEVSATAQSASDSATVRRTSVLAIDTSNSMKGPKFRQAKAAAMRYLDVVPADVYVGMVAFDKTVRVLSTPTLDRAPIRAQINGLTLAYATALNKGVLQAVSISGTKGSRNVLVLSDGEDTTSTPLSAVTDQVKSSGVKVDVVALQQSGKGLLGLTSIAQAGHGSVIRADDPATVTRAFRDEANALVRQVLVTAAVPAGKRTDGNVEVSINDQSRTWTTSAYTSVRVPASQRVDSSGNRVAVPAAPAALQISTPLMAGAVALIGIGVVGILATMLLGGKKDKTSALEEQIANYGSNAKSSKRKRVAEPKSLGQRATQQAASVLANNSGLEARIAGRLEGASVAFKPAEWLLLHAAVAFSTSLVFLLIGGGNLLFLLFGIAIGVVAPWLYLGRRKKRRMRAFQAALPDTLQLMAGSLSAGLSLAQSVDTIVREGGEPITSEFHRVIVESRLGVTLEDAMEGVAQRMDSRDFEWVVMAIRIQRDVGGNLSELLLTVAETLREREYIRRHVRGLSAEGRLSCYVLGGLPPVFVAYLSLTKWDYVSPLFTTPTGYGLCILLVVLLSVGIFWMSKVSKVEL